MPSNRNPLSTVSSGAGKLHADIATASSQLFPDGGNEELLSFLNAVAKRELAIVRKVGPIAAAGLSSFDIRTAGETNPIWVGNGGEALSDLFIIVEEDTGTPFKEAGTAQVVVASLTGAAVGAGFTAADPLTLNFNTALPTGPNFEIWYAVQGQIATTPVEAFSLPNIRQSSSLPAAVQTLLEDLHAASGQAWDDPLDSDIESLATAGLNERYRRQTTVAGAFNYDTPGDGAIIVRDGIAPTVEADVGTPVDYANAFRDPYSAHWLSKMGGGLMGTPSAENVMGGSGFVSVASVRYTNSADELTQLGQSVGSHVTALLRDIGADTLNAADVRTRMRSSIACELNPTAGATDDARREIDATSTNFFQNASGNQDIAVGYDLIEVCYTGPLAARTPEIYVITQIMSATRIRVRTLGGAPAAFPTGTTTTDTRCQLIKTVFHQGGGLGSFAQDNFSHTDGVQLDTALYHAVAPPLTDDPSTAGEYVPKAARFLAAARTAAEYSHGGAIPNAVEWGGFDATVSTPQSYLSALRGDGGLTASIVQNTRHDVTVAVGGTTTWHPALDGSILQVEFTHAAADIAWTLAMHADYAPVIGERIEIMLVPSASAPPGGTAEVTITWPSGFPGGFVFEDYINLHQTLINEITWYNATYLEITGVGSFWFVEPRTYSNYSFAQKVPFIQEDGRTPSGGGTITWRPMSTGGYLSLDIADTDVYTLVLTGESGQFPAAGFQIYIEVEQGLGNATMVWPVDFIFSGADALIPLTIGDRVLYKGIYSSAAAGWLMTRTDY